VGALTIATKEHKEHKEHERKNNFLVILVFFRGNYAFLLRSVVHYELGVG
jgi:hypothetical protein